MLTLEILLAIAVCWCAAALSFFVHEMGHATAAIALFGKDSVSRVSVGVGPRVVWHGKLVARLFPISGRTWVVERDLTPVQAAFISLAGPVASILLGLSMLLLANHHDQIQGRQFLIVLGQINMAIAAMNLLPVPPLDGWRAIEPDLCRRYGWHPASEGMQIAYRAGYGVLAAANVWVAAWMIWGRLVG
jgi:Zn-dependent protease